MNFLPGDEIEIQNNCLFLPKDVFQQYQEFGINSLFDWQSECLKLPGVLDGTKNLVYSAPTSAGKTLVSEIILLKRVLKTKRKVLFVLPYVSVSREKMIYFKKLFGGVGLKVDGFMGNASPKGGLAVIDVAICTIEKANGLINRMIDEESLDQLSLIIVDELHMLGDSHRGYILELLLTKVLFHTKSMSNNLNYQQTQIIGMSATLPNLNIVAAWLKAELYVCEFRPIPLLEMIKCESSIFDCQDFSKPLRLFKPPEGVSVKDEGHIIALCLETVLDGHGCLIFCPTKVWCETLSLNIATEIVRLCRIADKEHLENGHILRKIVSKPELEECVENLKKCPSGLDDQLEKVVPFGVAFHHAGLTTEERDVIETYFREGHIKTLIATSTLSSGVNLPARRVIIRTPVFNKTFIDHMTYKQMIGRAGRKGIDIKGESVIVCKTQEFEKLKGYLSLGIQPIKSCLDRNDSLSLKRALLEVIVPRVVHTVWECVIYLKSSFLQYTLDEKCAKINCKSENDDQSYNRLVVECLKYLEKSDLISISSQESDNDRIKKRGRPKKSSEKSLSDFENDYRSVQATSLGHAVLSASLGPEDGLTVFHELDKARRSLVLDTDLHLIYLLTPVYLDVGTSINWSCYSQIVSLLSEAETRVMKVIGITERFINKCERCGPPVSGNNEFQTHKRFYSALILFHLVNERPFNDIIATFDVQKGNLQALQMQAATYAGMVTIFCNRLGWSHLEVLVKGFQKRMIFGVSEELIDLVRLTLVNGSRARVLYKAGFETVSAIAGAKVKEIANILRKSLPFQSAKVGNHVDEMKYNCDKINDRILGSDGKSLTVNDGATEIIKEAQFILQRDLELLGIVWNPPDFFRIEDEDQSKDNDLNKNSVNSISNITNEVKEKSLNESERNKSIYSDLKITEKNKRKRSSNNSKIFMENISPSKRSSDSVSGFKEIEKIHSIHFKKVESEKDQTFDEKSNTKLKDLSNNFLDKVVNRSLSTTEQKGEQVDQGDVNKSSLFKDANCFEKYIEISNNNSKLISENSVDSEVNNDISSRESKNKTNIKKSDSSRKIINSTNTFQDSSKVDKELLMLEDDSFDIIMQDYKIENDDEFLHRHVEEDIILIAKTINQDNFDNNNICAKNNNSKKEDYVNNNTINKSNDSVTSNKYLIIENNVKVISNTKNKSIIDDNEKNNLVLKDDQSCELYLQNMDNSLEDVMSNITNKGSELLSDSLIGCDLDESVKQSKSTLKMSTPKKNQLPKSVTFDDISPLLIRNDFNNRTQFKKPKSVMSRKTVSKNKRTSIISENQTSLFDSVSVAMSDSNSEVIGTNCSSDLFDSYSTNAKNSYDSEDLFSIETDDLSNSASNFSSHCSNLKEMIDNNILVPNTPNCNSYEEKPMILRSALSTVEEISLIQSIDSECFVKEVCGSRYSWNLFISEFDKWKADEGASDSNIKKKIISLSLMWKCENNDRLVTGVVIYSECSSSIFSIALANNPGVRVAISFKRRSEFIINLILSSQFLLISFDWALTLSLLGKLFNVNLYERRIDNLVDLLIMNWVLNSEDACHTFLELCRMYDLYLESDAKVIQCTSFLKNDNSSTSVTEKEAVIQAKLNMELVLKIKACFLDVPNYCRLFKHCFSVEIPINLMMNSLNSGFCVDLNRMQEEIEKVINVANILKDMAFLSAGKIFNIDIAKEVSKVLFMDMRLPVRGILNTGVTDKRKTNFPKLTSSTKKNLLHLIPIHPLPGIIIEYRRLKMVVEKTLNPLLECCKKVISEEKPPRIRCVYQHLTCTGRITSTQPNLQSVPKTISINWFNILQLHRTGEVYTKAKELNIHKNQDSSISVFRSCFFASEGCILVSADYKQLELRILTHLSADLTLMKLFTNEAKFDIFYNMASKWLNISLESVTETDRQRAKQISYGIIYGMSAQGLSEEMSIEENIAQQMIDDFMRAFPGLNKFIITTIENCRTKGYIETISGRRRFLPEINSKNLFCRAHAERQSVHSTIQGSAADIVKTAMVKLDSAISTEFSSKSKKRKSSIQVPKLVLHLHDELIYEVPENYANQMSLILKQNMENVFDLNVLLPVTVKIGKSWSDLSEYEYNMSIRNG